MFYFLADFNYEYYADFDYANYRKSKNKQETLRVVTIAMICFTLIHFENLNISRGLYITQLKICDGAFIAKIVIR